MQAIQDYLGQNVVLTLNSAVPTRIPGVLKACDHSFIVLEQPDGKPELIVPINSVLHIELTE